MKLTNNFSLKEFIHSRFYKEHQDVINEIYEDNQDEILPNIIELAEQLQIVRDYIDLPISINIAYRPKWWEIKQGRSGNSQHCLGKGADIVIDDFPAEDVYNLFKFLIERGDIKQGGLGKYKSFTHYDIRSSGKARWVG